MADVTRRSDGPGRGPVRRAPAPPALPWAAPAALAALSVLTWPGDTALRRTLYRLTKRYGIGLHEREHDGRER